MSTKKMTIGVSKVKAEWDRDTAEERDIRVIFARLIRLMPGAASLKQNPWRKIWSDLPLVTGLNKRWKDASTYSGGIYFGLEGYPGAITLKEDEDRWKN